MKRQGRIAPITFLAMGLAAGSAGGQSYPVYLVAGHSPVFPWIKHLTESFIPAVDAALEGTGYEIEWKEFYGGSLATLGGVLEAVEAGLADIALVMIAFEPANLPLQNISYIAPFGSPSPEVVVMIMDALHGEVPGMLESWRAYGLEYLGGGFALDDYLLMTRFPVNSVDDLQGRRIGAPGAAVNWVQGTGAVGVSSDLSRYYNDIHIGVYDGAIVFATAAVQARLQEVAPYITITNFGAQYGGPLVANRAWLEGLPDEVVAALRQGAADFAQAYLADQPERVEAALQSMIDDGAIITSLPETARIDWAGSLTDVPSQWATFADGRGLPGTKVLTAFMQALRDAGARPPRDWDIVLPEESAISPID